VSPVADAQYSYVSPSAVVSVLPLVV